jgi:ATP-dependent Clp protease ATP-binding subunit ClpA
VLRRVAAEAERLGAEAIGSEHVMRALLRSRGSVAVSILEDLGMDTSRVARTLRTPRPEA